MIYIKLFESFDEDLYVPISFNEYIEWASGEGQFGKPISFTEDEINQIKSSIPPGDRFHLIQNAPISPNPKGQLIIISRKLKSNKPVTIFRLKVPKVYKWDDIYDMTITKHEDEWFLCNVKINRPGSLYKCDGIDGLIKLIKDKLKSLDPFQS